MKRHLIGVAAIVLGTALVGGVGVQTASAVDAPTSVTLPLFGVPLIIDITTGPGSTLTDVSVDAANAATTLPTAVRPHKVTFESANPDATGEPGKVTVKSKRGTQTVTARAGSLANVTGPGSWTGDLFGNGTRTTVAFEVVNNAGIPDITVTPVAGGVVGEVKHSSETDDDGDVTESARVSVKFTDTGAATSTNQSRTVTISVKSRTAADGTTSAKLSVSLSKLTGVAVDAAVAAGPHSWTDLLCDGTTATINYVVAEDGTVSGVTATPDAEIKTNDSKIDVRFSDDERVRIRVRSDDGQIKISVDNRIRCRDAADPTVNGSVVPTTVDDDDDANEDANEHQGGRHGGHDDDTTTTVTVAG